MPKKTDTSGYSGADIQVLEGLDAVRKRPAMYIQGTDSRGLSHLLAEIADNSVDEAIAGYADRVEITYHQDGSIEVEDNGRGIPVDVQEQTGLSAVEVIFTVLHAGGKFGGKGYATAGGLHGVGSSVVNALSKRLDVTVYRDGKTYEMTFDNGIPGVYDKKGQFTQQSGVREVGKAPKNHTGTKVRFWPDMDIFEPGAHIERDYATQRARQTAFLVPGLTMQVRDLRNSEDLYEETFKYDGGTKDMVQYYNHGKHICDPVQITGQGTYMEKVPMPDETGKMRMTEIERTVHIDISFQWNNGYNDSIHSFVNVVTTPHGGTHQEGFKRGLLASIRKGYEGTRIMKQNEDPVIWDDTIEGLTAVISVSVPEPQFIGQTKEELGTPGVTKAVQEVTAQGVRAWLEGKKKTQARTVLEKIANAARTRVASRTQREAARRKTALEGASMPAKLVDCRSIGVNRSELQIVEGDSALGCGFQDVMVATVGKKALSFKELAEDWEKGITHFGYASDENGDVIVVPLLEPRLTKKNASLVMVTLDNGEELKFTPDHPFRLRDGSYKRADQLQSGDSLMPLYRRYASGKENELHHYEMVQQNSTQKWVYTHHLANEHDLSTNYYGEEHHSKELPARFSHKDLWSEFGDNQVEFTDVSVTHNHKVVSMEHLEEMGDVYDITVEHYHNFALDAGVFVHNSARAARNSEYQALLPIRGKILNVQKATLSQILNNTECASIIQVIGAGSGRSFDLDAMRYHRIIIMADADVDGSHIRVLLITLFNKLMKPVIEAGRLYTAVPPLFKIETTGRNKETIYAYTKAEMEKITAQLDKSGKGYKTPVSRFKGLGEMDSEELWETTLNPDVRTLRQITLGDAEEAERTLELLMGDKVEPRRDWIIGNADRVSLEDIDA